jgi:GAF domain-containing protein
MNSRDGAERALETILSIGAQSTEASVLRVLVELGVQAIDADEGSLLVLDPSANELVFSMVVGVGTEDSALLGKRVPVGKGLTGLAAVTREVQIGAPTYVVGQESKGGAGPQAVIAAPMLVRDECVGVLTAVSFKQGRRFQSRDAALYARLATVAAVLVQQRKALDASAGARDAGRQDAAHATHERRIARSVLRISRAAPDALAHVADVLRSIESIACPEDDGE